MWLLSAAARFRSITRIACRSSDKALRLALPISMESNWRWRWLDTFRLVPRRHSSGKVLYPEVYRWFRDTGFE
jgi:hypothetical protein